MSRAEELATLILVKGVGGIKEPSRWQVAQEAGFSRAEFDDLRSSPEWKGLEKKYGRRRSEIGDETAGSLTVAMEVKHTRESAAGFAEIVAAKALGIDPVEVIGTQLGKRMVSTDERISLDAVKTAADWKFGKQTEKIEQTIEDKRDLSGVKTENLEAALKLLEPDLAQ